MTDATVTLLGSGERLALSDCTVADLAGASLYRTPDGRWLAPAFRAHAVDLGRRDLPDDGDDVALGELVLAWVDAVRRHDWSRLGGQRLESEDDWVGLRTAMVRVGWGPAAAGRAWQACREQPYSRDLPTAGGWAGAGWVVPALGDEPEPAFARPVLEARGLHRWAYIARWAHRPALPPGDLPTEPEPADPSWADVLSRLRQDHHTGDSAAEAETLAVQLLRRADLGHRSPEEAEDDPLPDRDVAPACAHPSPLVRAAAWFLLQDEAERWLACTYGECQHHWAVEAEEETYELEEVLELAGRGVADPVDAARQRRRLLDLAFGDVSDVPLAGAGDLDDFLAFYHGWVARGRPEEELRATAERLRGD